MRQVNGWGFKRIVSGNDHNSYYHELFVRDVPQLCLKMKRVKKGESNKAKPGEGSGEKEQGSEGKDKGPQAEGPPKDQDVGAPPALPSVSLVPAVATFAAPITANDATAGLAGLAAGAPSGLAGLAAGAAAPVMGGLDSVTILKLQEALAATGGNVLLQQQQQQQVPQLGGVNFGLLTSQLGGQNAALLAAQLQAATQKPTASEATTDDKTSSSTSNQEAV